MVKGARRSSFWERKGMWKRKITEEKRVRKGEEHECCFPPWFSKSHLAQGSRSVEWCQSPFPPTLPLPQAGLGKTKGKIKRRQIQRDFQGRTDSGWCLQQGGDRVKGNAEMTSPGEEEKQNPRVERVVCVKLSWGNTWCEGQSGWWVKF